MTPIVLTLALTLLAASPAWSAEVYEWIDEPPSDRPGPVPTSPDKVPRLIELVKSGYRLSAGDVRILEDRLQADPGDLAARARLLGYYFARSITVTGPAATLEARRRHIFWLIQNRPQAEIAGMSEATIDPAGHRLADRAGYEQASALWLKQVEAPGSNPAVLRHAARFFTLPDKEVAERILKRGQALDPQKDEWSQGLAYLYALGVMGIDGLNQNGLPTSVDRAQETGPFAARARNVLEGSRRATDLLVAGRILGLYGSMIRALRLTRQDHTVLAETLLKKAQALGAPGPEVAGELQRLYEFRRLPPAGGQ